MQVSKIMTQEARDERTMSYLLYMFQVERLYISARLSSSRLSSMFKSAFGQGIGFDEVVTSGRLSDIIVWFEDSVMVFFFSWSADSNEFDGEEDILSGVWNMLKKEKLISRGKSMECELGVMFSIVIFAVRCSCFWTWFLVFVWGCVLCVGFCCWREKWFWEVWLFRFLLSFVTPRPIESAGAG